MSPINVLSLALGSIIGWGAFIMPGTTFLPGSGPLGTAIGMAVAAVIMCAIFSGMIGFFYTSLSTFKEHKKSGEKNGIIVATSILGCIFGLMFVSFLIVPGMPGYLGIESRICLGVWVVLGIVLKFANKNK